MIKMLYYVKPNEKQDELTWLHEQKVYPACQEVWDWRINEARIGFGVIVSPETALAIKLRHKLEIQLNYKQR